ncbi:MAG: hypothetical protein SGPRY_011857, partial [Prymnesium sp.]
GKGVALFPPAWADLREVTSGRFATGFMHGSRNGTHALSNGQERTTVALSRLLDREASPSDPPIRFHPTTAIPLIPLQLFHSVAAKWASYETAELCVCDMSKEPAEGGCDAMLLLNQGKPQTEALRERCEGGCERGGGVREGL